MNTNQFQLLLADDDEDDCLFFKQALAELATPFQLAIVNDGEQLMNRLIKEPDDLPHILFLDLNMPRKNGFECLAEIKQDALLKGLPIIILSTYFEEDIANRLYEDGAHYCIRKPAEFAKLKQVIDQALIMTDGINLERPPREHFILGGESTTGLP